MLTADKVTELFCMADDFCKFFDKMTEKYTLKSGNKRLPNEVGGMDTTLPEEVHTEMKALLKAYNSIKNKTLEDVIDLHQRFEAIHPFQDGNGRVGRLLMFKECLATGHIPFIITEELKMFYYRGLQQWPRIKGYLMDTCLTAQDFYKEMMAKFGITVNEDQKCSFIGVER